MKRSPIRLHTKLLLSFSSLMVFFLLVEVILRFAGALQETGDQRNLPFWVLSNIQAKFLILDPIRFWKITPSTPRYHTNSIGIVGPETKAEKAADVFRIICLGDSITYGFGVNYQDAYPFRLDQLLNNTRTPLVYEVWNAGVPGYSSLQGLRYFKHELRRFHPDVVTMCFGRNDRRFLNQEGGYLPDRQVRIYPAWITAVRSWLAPVRTYQVLKYELLRLRSRLVQTTGQSSSQTQACRVEPEEFTQNMNELLSLCRSSRAEPIMLTAPVRYPEIGNYNELNRDIASRQQVDLIDVEQEFNRRDNRRFLLDDCHPNAMGHELIADLIYRKSITIVAQSSHVEPDELNPPEKSTLR